MITPDPILTRVYRADDTSLCLSWYNDSKQALFFVFGSYHHSTFGARDEAAKRLRFVSLFPLRLASLFQTSCAVSKSFFVTMARACPHAIHQRSGKTSVKRIGKDKSRPRLVDSFSAAGYNPALHQKFDTSSSRALPVA